MSDIDMEYLFTPGGGGMPLYLAGRQREQEYFQFEQLSHLGYVWQIRGYDYEPGIPSLMSFVQEHSSPQT